MAALDCKGACLARARAGRETPLNRSYAKIRSRELKELYFDLGTIPVSARRPAAVSSPSVVLPLRAHLMICFATRLRVAWSPPPAAFSQTRSSATVMLASARESNAPPINIAVLRRSKKNRSRNLSGLHGYVVNL